MKLSATVRRRLQGGATHLLAAPVGRFALSFAVFALVAATHYVPQKTHTAPSYSTARQTDNHLIYNEIFAAQDKGDFSRADQLMSQLTDQRLLGYVLAERYLNPAYKPRAQELSDWLANYPDHPQAREILALAEHLHATVPAGFSTPAAPLAGAGSNLQMGRGTMPDGWYHGLRLWREKQYAAAAPIFLQVANNDSLNDWQRAAGAFWAYRAYHELHENEEAANALKLAATYKETFYGMLAATARGEKIQFAATLPAVPDAIWQDAATQRAKLLTELDRNGDAEAELRQRYTTLNSQQRVALISVAAALDLPNLQMRLAQTSRASDAEAMAARYPMPATMLHAQNKVHPALLMAVAMQESGFREEIRSPGGAMGMMQMLPSTAQRVAAMSQDVALAAASNDATLSLHDRLNDMAMSTRLGANYFTLLSQQPAIGHNAIYQIAAYNAGPGTVASWQKMARSMNDDPLLFLESIPYPETHNYVTQVMAHMWVYQVLMGKQPRGALQLAHGEWPTMPALQTTKPAV